MEVTAANFHDKFTEISGVLTKCKIISIDCEFSALYPVPGQVPSLFDSPEERYEKLRKNVKQIVPMQVGVTAFLYDAQQEVYEAKTYSFYVKPACSSALNTTFSFESTSLEFLVLHGFDFNKFALQGVSFVNRLQEDIVRRSLSQFEENECNFSQELRKLCDNEGKTIESCLEKARIEELCDFTKVLAKHAQHHELLYFLKRFLSRKFKKLQWHGLSCKKVEDNPSNLQEELLSNLLGFTRVFRLITQLKKPLIGHNLLMDLMVLTQNFEVELPQSYVKFKAMVNKLFPEVYDTKVLSYELKPSFKSEFELRIGSLDELYNKCFNYNRQRKMKITEYGGCNEGKFHDAAWDSYCTGYIFLVLTQLHARDQRLEFLLRNSTSLLGILATHKNCVNVIRGSISHLCLDKEDPLSTRPPFLVVSTKSKQRIEPSKVLSQLSNYGFVELRRLSWTSSSLILAVDNFASCRRMLEGFSHHDSEFSLTKYESWARSRRIQSLLWILSSSILVVGSIIVFNKPKF